MICNINLWKSLSLLWCCLSHSISANTWEIVFFFVRAQSILTISIHTETICPHANFVLLCCPVETFVSLAGLHWGIWFMESNEVFTSIHIIIHMMLCVWIVPWRLIILLWLWWCFTPPSPPPPFYWWQFVFLCQWPTRLTREKPWRKIRVLSAVCIFYYSIDPKAFTLNFVKVQR